MKNECALRPLVEEVTYISPIDAFTPFAGFDGALLLDSAKADGKQGRFAFIALDPYRVITSKDGTTLVDGERVIGEPFSILKRFLKDEKLATIEGLPPFQGGAAGLFGYDLAWNLEHLPTHQPDDMGFPDMSVGFYDLVMAFDLQDMRCWIISTGLPAENEETRLSLARARLDDFKIKLQAAPSNSNSNYAGVNLDWRYSDQRDEYMAKVAQVIDYIYAGDIFQANFTQRFDANLPKGFDVFSFYRHLQDVNPAPFSGFYKQGDMVIASSSPERFLKLDAGAVETRPIKGTRPRGDTPAQDKALAEELEKSAKDRSENVMIVDLLRNDLSKVCAPNTVDVPELCNLESYASVHHLVSSVVGQLKEGFDATDLLRAAFPGGSITGAPKIRAMEIIAELESYRRGPYCGALGFIGFDGGMDSNILIRTVCVKADKVYFHAGGGIVADSDPADEYDESLVKAKRLFEAFAGHAVARAS